MTKVYRNENNVTIKTTRTRLGQGNWNEVSMLPWETFIEYIGFRLFLFHCLRGHEHEYIDTRMQKEEKR
jgi:hypothetical protein